MKCPECHFENQEAANFCYECGHSFPLTSKATSQVISFDEKLANIQRYLPQGISEKILRQREKLEGERRQVTVMFCDMEGFTPLVDMLGPEEAYRIMDQVYEILIHSVHDFEGTVNEMTGDGIMALFGAPIALEDAPQRALRSAISIHRDMDSFSAKNKGLGPLRMRIGIHTGPVVVGTLGNNLRVEFKAVGNTVNLASRMEKLAKAGSTYVTEETFKQTRQLFRFETVGKKSVKGKKESILVYKVLSAKKDVFRPRIGSERIIFSRMVGRDKELNRLELQVMKLINGEGSVVNIIGEAGIGKSRLVAELKRHDAIKRTTLFEGSAISIGKNLNFYPIIDLLKQWARIGEDDGEAMALGKLETAVKNLYPENFAEVLPFVATLMGMKLSGKNAERVRGIEGEALEKLILKNLRELIIRATQQTPLVIVFEDLHWADTSSIELMESLFRLAEIQRILFINVFRPGHKETGERIVETVKERLPVYYVEIVLRPLDESESEALITNMLNIGEIHHAIIGEIARRTGGNPFFMEEVVRSLIDQRAIILKNSTFQVTKKIEAVAIPNTVNDVLMARIDRLEDESRKLIKIASVIGRNFFYRILSEVAGTVEDMEGKLSYLKQAEFIRERKRMGEVEFLFKHALTQGAAYESILPQKRKELHLRVARSIEKIFGERLHEFYGVLAYHFSMGENLEMAEEYIIKAGEEALRSAASDEALHYYEEALELYQKKSGPDADPEKVAMLEKNIALALYNRGLHKEAIKYFDKALNYYWGKLPKGKILSAIKLLSAILHFLIALYLPFLKFRKTPTERDIENVNLFFKKVNSISLTNAKRFFVEYFFLFRFISSFDLRKFRDGYGIFLVSSALFTFSGISFALSRKALDAVRKSISHGDVINYTMYEIIETVHHFLGGNWKSLKDYDEDLVDKNCKIGEIYNASQYLYWHAFGNICQGAFDKAESIVKRLDDLFEVYGNDLSKNFKYHVNTWLLIESDKLNAAMKESEKGIAFEEKTRSGFWMLHIWQAWIHIKRGAIQEAEEALERADEISLKAERTPFHLSPHLKTQLDLDLYRLRESIKGGKPAEVQAFQRKAFKSGRLLQKVAQKAAYHRTDSYRLMGAYYWTINGRGKAFESWHRGIQEGERLGARPQLARLYFEVGRCLLEEKGKQMKLDGIEGEAYLDRARALYEEMKMESCLEDIDHAVEMRTV
jgi:class 3 adenylate cyclase/tetratricopeptide (TPR) repeat protein